MKGIAVLRKAIHFHLKWKSLWVVTDVNERESSSMKWVSNRVAIYSVWLT